MLKKMLKVVVIFCLAIGSSLLLAVVSNAEQPTTVVASGASFPTGAYKALSFAFGKEIPQYRLEYTPLTSTRGRCRLMVNCPVSDNANPHYVDWIAVVGPLPNSDYNSQPDIHLFPSFAGAVVPIYNLGPGVDLILSLPILARIFRQCAEGATCPSGWITYWNDSDIVALNPHIDPEVFSNAGRIIPVVWADKAGTTETFKNTLALNDAGFATQMAGELTDSTNWPNASYVRANTNRGVSARVLATPSSIGYVSLDEAAVSNLPHAALGKSFIQPGKKLRATADSVLAALMEKGLDYGNNNEDPSRLTSNAYNAKGSEAWPLVQFTYFAMLNNTLRPQSTCVERIATMAWFDWFYSTESSAEILNHLGFAPLPEAARTRILQLIRDSYRCNGELVYRPGLFASDNSTVTANAFDVLATEELYNAVDLYSLSYETQYRVLSSVTEDEVGLPLTAKGVTVLDRIAVNNLPAELASKVSMVPLAAVPWGVIYNLCDARLPIPCDPNTVAKADLVLSGEVIADILAGRIISFNDSKILDIQGNAITRAALPNKTFTVFIPPTSDRAFKNFLTSLRARGYDIPEQLPSTFIVQSSLRDTQSMVAATTYSLTFGPANRYADTTVFRIAKLRDTIGENILEPTDTTIQACFSSPEMLAQFLSSGFWNAEMCWPITEPYFLAIPSQFSDADCFTEVPQSIVKFASFILTDQGPLRELGMSGIDNTAALNQLNQLTCFGRSILNPTVDMQYLPYGLLVFTRVMASLMVCIYCMFIAWIFVHRKSIEHSRTFLLETVSGSLIQLLAVFPLTIQDNETTASQSVLDASCMAGPWLYVLGLGLVYAPMLARSWRVRTIFFNPKLRMYGKNDVLWGFQIGFLLPLVGLLILWSVIDPYTWARQVTQLDPTSGFVVQTAGRCVSNNLAAYVIPILLYIALWLVAGIVLALSNRKASGQYILVRNLSLSTLILAQVLIIGIPVLLLVDNLPLASFIVKVCVVFFTALSTTLLLFVPVFVSVSGWRFFASSSDKGSRDASKNSGTNINKVASGRIVAVNHSSKDSLQETGREIVTSTKVGDA